MLIGRTVLRQQEQAIYPNIQFTCSGSITQWKFVAMRQGDGGRNRYPELQIWRPQNARNYSKVHSVALSPQNTQQLNVYSIDLSTAVAYQTGDVLGIYHPPKDSSVYRIYSIDHSSIENYYLDRQDSSSVHFDVQNSALNRNHADYPLVGVETSQ